MALRLDDTGFGGIMIYQDPEQFCYGVDAVLLADFAAKGAAKSGENGRVLDLGTGNGIVPLILSHKTKAHWIGGVELQTDVVQLAEKSSEFNGLSGRVHFFNADVSKAVEWIEKTAADEVPAGGPQGKIAELGSLAGCLDVVTSNPPYMKGETGIESAMMAKALARHEIAGGLDDFLAAAALMLKDKGDFYMVHRPGRLVDICEGCRRMNLEPKEMRFVSGKPWDKPNIMLVHCVKNGGRELKILEPLFVHDENGKYSQEILEIYEKC